MRNIDLSSLKNKKTALVCSGGVVKAAAWHLGVGLALDELGFSFKSNNSKPNDLEISTYVGSSAGALVSLYFASGFKPMDIIEASVDKNHQKLKPVTYRDMLYLRRPIQNPPKSDLYEPLEGFPTLLKRMLNPLLKVNGLFSTHGLHKYISEQVLISNDFRDYEADLFIVATQLDHSRKCIFSKYNYPNPHHDSTAHYYTDIPIAESVSASMSVPPFYSPYPIRNPRTKQTDYYIDGEIRETLSTHVSIDNGCDYVISSWTHTPYHYHDEIGSLINYGLPAICVQSIYLLIQKKIVESRARRNTARDILNTVREYMRSNKFSREHEGKILNILERKLNYNPNIKLIDIYPRHRNYKIFFMNSFSLNPDKMSEIVRMGYKRTFEVFKKREWED